MPYKNKTDLYENQARHRQANKERMWNYLLEHPCVDCGLDDPRILEFDHVRGEKSHGVARMVTGSTFSWKRIEAEIAKCEVRCANCHRLRHYVENNYFSPN